MRGLVGGLILCLFISQAEANVVVWNDPGGMVLKYARDIQRAKMYGWVVKIRGFCASACTLWLSLPPENLCLYPDTVFIFHAAHSSQRYEDKATEYLWKQYPGWVRAWIMYNGGLDNRDIYMPYAYASQYVKQC